MAATVCQDHTRVAARLEVPRDAAGDLQAGVRSKLDRADGVEVVDVDVLGLEPRLNDLTVEVEAILRFTGGDPRAIADLVGVHEVTVA